MKKFFLYLFALIGVLSIVLSGYRAYKFEKVARTYLKRCQLVEEGMTLNQAREIIGDLKFEGWTQDKLSGEIIIWDSGGDDVRYALVYPMVFAGSDNMRVFFDPNTLVVTSVFCDE